MIQVRNLYALLAFAMREMDVVTDQVLGRCDFDEPLEVLALLLESACSRAFKRGIERRYNSRDDQGARPQGRLDVGRTIAGLLHLGGQLAFEVDELTTDTPSNRLIKRALHRVAYSGAVAETTQRVLKMRLRQLGDVREQEKISEPSRAGLRRGAAYRSAIFLSELVLAHKFVDGGSDGAVRGWARAEQEMPGIYERFVRGFMRYTLGREYAIGARHLDWPVGCERVSDKLPLMRTDAHVASPDGRRSIVECKFYDDPFQSSHRSDKRTFRSAHLYQILAYLQADASATGACGRGLIVYAHHEHSLDEQLQVHGFALRVATVNLNLPWPQLKERMQDLTRWAAHAA